MWLWRGTEEGFMYLVLVQTDLGNVWETSKMVVVRAAVYRPTFRRCLLSPSSGWLSKQHPRIQAFSYASPRGPEISMINTSQDILDRDSNRWLMMPVRGITDKGPRILNLGNITTLLQQKARWAAEPVSMRWCREQSLSLPRIKPRSSRPGLSKLRPAGQIRPAVPFSPDRERN
jgi:hypothetical protein